MQIDVFIVISLDIGQVNAEKKIKEEGVDLAHIADQDHTQVAIHHIQAIAQVTQDLEVGEEEKEKGRIKEKGTIAILQGATLQDRILHIVQGKDIRKKIRKNIREMVKKEENIKRVERNIMKVEALKNMIGIKERIDTKKNIKRTKNIEVKVQKFIKKAGVKKKKIKEIEKKEIIV